MKISTLLIGLSFLVFSLGIGSCASTPKMPPGPFNNLVWSDEFNGTGIDTATWKYETYATGWRHEWNNELQDFVDDGSGGQNAFIATDADGTSALVLRATRKAAGNKIHAFNSARLNTQASRSFSYGRIEARMALPKGNGIWPAFWMLGNTNIPWPRCGEIDIMEMIGGSTGAAKNGGDNTVFSTLHWGSDPNHPSFSKSLTLPDASQYHLYRLEWDDRQMLCSVDGQVYFEIDIGGPAMAAFRQPFYLILNLAVGGNWPGNPDASTIFPQDFRIDYIRVYQ